MKNNTFPVRIWLILLACTGVLCAASIKGVVQDPLGKPLAGVAVVVKEEGHRFLTGADGRFTATVAEGRQRVRLLFDLPGYLGATQTLEAGQFAAPLTVVLQPLEVLNEEVTVTAPRQELPLTEASAAVSMVTPATLSVMPRGIAADEALKPVPGVKVDNQANGERVHLSIRGQGILSERGIRGIQVMLDGIPLNDPSGFAPDLFNIDWTTLSKIEVIRGPLGFLYGGGSAGGVLSLETRNGASVPLSGTAWASVGSYGFWKGMVEAGGTAGAEGAFDYRISASHAAGDGYRDHTAFWANNLYGKFRLTVSPKFKLQAIVAGTGFWNENAEGLNLTWLQQNRRQANPDANTYNEFQKTRRFTTGINGLWSITPRSSLSMTVYGHSTLYLEAVPSSVQHRRLTTPGFLAQYQLDWGGGKTTSHLNAGIDYDWQGISDLRRPNLGGAREGDVLVADQDIGQRGYGAYILNRVDIGSRWSVLAGLRLDQVRNQLTDNLKANGLDLSGKANFERTTARVGLSYTPRKGLTLYANWGMGFLPPATEELYANPDALGGFNATLKPATSSGFEVGARGSFRRLLFDLALFHLKTRDDFERYRMSNRPLETFYRNAGNSRRNGIEASLSWYPLDRLELIGAYTYSDFKYTEYQSATYPGDLVGHRLPNSPVHQLYLDACYRLKTGLFAGVSVEGYSRAYVDATNAAWIDGYALLHARIGWRWVGRGLQGEIFLSGKNVTNKEYIAFTEPDPDGNSYQPGPTREFFATAQIRF